MKKISILLLLVSLAPLFSSAQNSKWFVSFIAAPTYGGPIGSIKNKMIKQGYDDQMQTTIFIIGWSSDYPRKYREPALLVKGGFQTKENRSTYFIAGISSKGWIEGFDKEGEDYAMYPFFGGSYGKTVEVKYSIFQLGAGYQYSYPTSRAKLSVGPSLYIFKYDIRNSSLSDKNTTLVPGANLAGRFPLGKERRLFGVDFFVDANLALPAKVKDEPVHNSSHKRFSAGSVNMIHGSIGLAYSFRKKATAAPSSKTKEN